MSFNCELWERACNASFARSLSQIKETNSIAGGAAVCAFPPCAPLRLLTPPQIATLVSAAVISAICWLLDYRLLRWRIIGKEVEGDKIWKNLRRFSGWTCAGCIAGAVACIAFMQFRDFDFESYAGKVSRDSPTGTNFIVIDRFYLATQASSFRYFIVFNVFQPLHIICVVFAWNMLLRRVSDHASHSYYNVARDQTNRRANNSRMFDWRDCIGEYARYNMVRSMHLFAMLLCSFDILARWVTAAGHVKRAGLYDQAAVSTSSSGAFSNATIAIALVHLAIQPVALVHLATPPKQYSTRLILVFWKYLYLSRLLTL